MDKEIKVLLYKEIEKADIKSVEKIAKKLSKNGELLLIYIEDDICFEYLDDDDSVENLAIALATAMSKCDEYKQIVMSAVEHYNDNREQLKKRKEYNYSAINRGLEK
jgi:hypothetical protein